MNCTLSQSPCATLPLAPVALVSGISCAVGIGTIVDARVSKDPDTGVANVLHLHVLEPSDLPLFPEQFKELAYFCDAQMPDIEDVLQPEGKDVVHLITIKNTGFDFSLQLPDPTGIPYTDFLEMVTR